MIALIIRKLGIRREEIGAVAWSFVYFFCVLGAYFMMRSMRDTMGIEGGVENIPFLFTGTFLTMVLMTFVFSWIASRYRRRQFLPWVYYFFVLNILLFFGAFTYAIDAGHEIVWIGRVFFVWLSVFTLFVVSVFWSFMADLYSKEQSRRLFGPISAGGSLGAILGPFATRALVETIGFQNILPMPALLLLIAVYCIFRLRRRVAQSAEAGTFVQRPAVIGGSVFAGVKLVFSTRYFAAIALALALANFAGFAVYMYMAEFVRDQFPTIDERIRMYADMDLAINVLAFLGQLLLVKHSVRKLGVGATLAILPIVSAIGFAIVAINPVFIILVAYNVLRRAITFGLSKPTSDMLYGVVSAEAKYKVKNFIETFGYRLWDVIAGFTIRAISGIGISGVAIVCIPVVMLWAVLAFWIGREYNHRDEQATQ